MMVGLVNDVNQRRPKAIAPNGVLAVTRNTILLEAALSDLGLLRERRRDHDLDEGISSCYRLRRRSRIGFRGDRPSRVSADQ